MTSILQPCDCSIIKAFKSNYRILFLSDAECQLNENSSYIISLKAALNLIGNARDLVSNIKLGVAGVRLM